MWSDEARAAAAEARRKKAHSSTHEGKHGNRAVANKAKSDHKPGLLKRAASAWVRHLKKGEEQGFKNIEKKHGKHAADIQRGLKS